MKLLARILQIFGAILLLYVAGVVIRASLFQSHELASFDRAAREQKQSRRTSGPAPKRGDVLGRIDIPKLHLSTVILEGDDDHELLLGAGHIPGTAEPGQFGNSAIAAHRDTFFRGLQGVAEGDELTIATLDGNYRYRVDWTKITNPDDVSVLRAAAQPALTLITCYPFSYIGRAPQRFIVHAIQIRSGADSATADLRR